MQYKFTKFDFYANTGSSESIVSEDESYLIPQPSAPEIRVRR